MAITSTSKKKDAAFKFMDFCYTRDGYYISQYGVLGKTYNILNGKPVYTDYMINNPRFDTETATHLLRWHFATSLVEADVTMSNPSVAKSPEAVANRTRWSDDPNTDSSYRCPPFSLKADETSRRVEIMTNVDTYADELILKFIIGAEPLSNFNAYLDQLNKLGVQEAIKLTQNAYNRYMSR
jgi:putative aldouronate transport system substrate-binding protein